MGTFLSIVQDAARESRTANPAPSTVVGVTGRQALLVGHVVSAWLMIQRAQEDWSFLKGEWNHALTINDMSYSGADLGIATRFGAWIGDRGNFRPTTLYDASIGQSDEAPITEVSYDYWRQLYDRGTHTANRPNVYAFAPDESIRFGPKPDKAYVARGEYRKGPQTLAADADVPDLPTHFHDAIVWRALVLLAQSDERADALSVATVRFAEIMHDMERALLPQFTISGGRK
jgi:hypothetical protein